MFVAGFAMNSVFPRPSLVCFQPLLALSLSRSDESRAPFPSTYFRSFHIVLNMNFGLIVLVKSALILLNDMYCTPEIDNDPKHIKLVS